MAKKAKKAVKKVKVKAAKAHKPAKKSKPAPKAAKKVARRKIVAPKKQFLPKRRIDSNEPVQKFILKSAVQIKVRDVDEKPLSASEVNKYRDILSNKRDELMEVVQRKKEQELQTADEELGDEADIATRSVEREMLFELTDSEKQMLDMVEASLRKLEKGVFGVCESCQKSIGRLRIDVMPWARYCIRCQSMQEVPSAPSTGE